MKKRVLYLSVVAAYVFLCGCTATDGQGISDEQSVQIYSADNGDYSQLISSGQGWGFVRKKGQAPEILSSQSMMLEKYGGYYLEKKGEKKDFLNNIDVLVDGKFELGLKDPDLAFRGSKNQRVIDIKKSIENKEVITLF